MNFQRTNLKHPSAGFNLIQMAMTVAIIGILSALAVPSLSFAINPLRDSGNRVKAQIKLARIKAISTTTAFRIKPSSTNIIEVQQHLPQAGSSLSTCLDAGTDTDASSNPLWDRARGFSDEDLTLDDGVELTSVSVNGITQTNQMNWHLCFDSRGINNQNIVLGLTEIKSGENLTIEIFPGGSIRLN